MTFEEEILKHIREGEKNLKAGEDVVLFVGKVGSGKTALFKYLFELSKSLRGFKSKSNRIYIEGEGVGNHGQNSTTVYPQVFSKDGIDYYDCPGFDGTIGSAHSIATSYLIKKIVDSAKGVKFVIVANYSDIIHDSASLLVSYAQLCDLVGDMKKLAKSVSLVTVGYYRRFTRDELRDLDNNVARSLSELNAAIKKGEAELENFERPYNVERRVLKKVISLLGEIMQRKLCHFPWLDPDNTDSFISSRSNILVLVESSSFYPVTQGEVNYIRNGFNDNDVRYLIEDSSREVCSQINLLCLSVSEYFEGLTKRIQMFNKLFNKIKKICSKLRHMKKCLLQARTADEFFSILLDGLEDLDLASVKETQKQLLERVHWLDVWQGFRRVKEQMNVDPIWLKSVCDVEIKCQNFESWYRILDQIYLHLSSYQIQLHKRRLTTLEPDNDLYPRGLAMNFNEQEVYLTTDNLYPFIGKLMRDCMGDEQELPQASFINETRLRHFYDLMNITLNTSVRYVNIDGYLTVEGNYIYLTTVLQKARLSDNFKSTKGIKLLAMDTIFIDCDFEMEGYDLIIISPKVEVLDSKKINMFNSSGEKAGNFLCICLNLTGFLHIRCGEEKPLTDLSLEELNDKDHQWISVNSNIPATKVFGCIPSEPKIGSGCIYLIRKVTTCVPAIGTGESIHMSSSESYNNLRSPHLDEQFITGWDKAHPQLEVRFLFAKAIIDYKMSMQKYLKNFYLGELLQTFNREIINSKETDLLYTIESLNYELYSFNRANVSNQHEVELQPFYIDLLKRVRRIVNNLDKWGFVDLKYEELSLSLSRKMEVMRNSVQLTLSSDVDGFFVSKLETRQNGRPMLHNDLTSGDVSRAFSVVQKRLIHKQLQLFETFESLISPMINICAHSAS